MPVIKSQNSPSGLVPFSMKDIEQQARAIMLRAQQRAEQLIAQAQVAAEELKVAAVAQGRQEGRAQGLSEGKTEGGKTGHHQALTETKQQLTQAFNALSTAAKDLNTSRKQLEAGAKADVVRLAVSIARRVTKKYGELDPAILTANVNEAMKLVVQASDVRIALHPSQHQPLMAALPKLKLQWPALEHVSLIEDAQVKPGGCRIQAGQGQVDASLDTQIDLIAGELLPAHAGEGGAA
jgi:flagellar assembly protein FliH